MDAVANPNGPVVTRPSIAQLLTLAWPIVISRSTQVVVGMTDALMVGKLGQDALAATTTGALNIWNILVFPFGVVFAVSTFTSQLVGAGRRGEARRYVGYGFLVAVAAAVAAFAAIPVIPYALSQLGYSPEVAGLMHSYLKIRLLSGGFAIGLEVLGNYYNGLGNSRLPMTAQVITMVLNVVFCWVFIYGNLGAPALGVNGSALAATLATTIGFGYLLACFWRRVGDGTKGIATPGGARLQWHEFKEMLRVGIPAGFNWFIEMTAFSAFVNIVLPHLGTAAVAALMSVIQLNSVSFMPAFALASAGSIFVGQALGAKAMDDVPRTVRMTALSTATWQGIVGVVLIAAPTFWMKLFLGDDPSSNEFLSLGANLLILSCAWALFDAVGMAIAESLRAAGDTLFTFWTRAVLAWGVFVPGAYISVTRFGVGAVGAAGWLMLYLMLLAVVLFFRFRQGKWRAGNLVDHAPGADTPSPPTST